MRASPHCKLPTYAASYNRPSSSTKPFKYSAHSYVPACLHPLKFSACFVRMQSSHCSPELVAQWTRQLDKAPLLSELKVIIHPGDVSPYIFVVSNLDSSLG